MAATKTATKTVRAQEPETPADKKAAKTVSKTKGETKAAKWAKAAKASSKKAAGKTKADEPKGKQAKDGEKKEPKPTIGATAVELLKGGMGAKEALEEIQKRFPDAKTSMACIYWYANHNDIRLQKPATKKEASKKAVASA